MTENNIKLPTINNETKLLILSVYILLCVVVVSFVFFVNYFILSNMGRWWILLLISINIILTLMTEMFRFDDSTGGYQNLLDNLKMGTLVFIILMVIVMKQYNIIFTTNEAGLVFVLIMNLILIVIKNMIRDYLSHKRV